MGMNIFHGVFTTTNFKPREECRISVVLKKATRQIRDYTMDENLFKKFFWKRDVFISKRNNSYFETDSHKEIDLLPIGKENLFAIIMYILKNASVYFER